MLGRGLESLIPPKRPFDTNQPQDNSGGTPETNQPAADISRAEHLPAETLAQAGPATPIPFGDEKKPEHSSDLSARYSGPDRGISAEDQTEKAIVFQIETDKIKPNPHQPRRDFNKVALEELANSIREFGIIQPLVVTKIEKETPHGWDVSYELVAGERRLLAAKLLGLRTIPAIIRQVPVEHEKLELAVTENIQRTNLNPIEFARAIAKLQEDFRLTQREVAARLGKSREAIANTLRLLSLPTDMQEAVVTGKTSESQARLLLSVEDPASRDKLFQEILSNNLTVRDVTQKVKELKGEKVPPPAKTIDPELLFLKEELEAALGAPVEIRKEGKGGKLTINFYSKEELEGLLERLRERKTDSAF